MSPAAFHPAPRRPLPGRVVMAASLGILLGIASPARAHEDLGPAIETASRAIEASPFDASRWLRRAELRRLARDFDGAAFDLGRAASFDPDLPGLTLSRASLALDRGAAAGALRVLDAAPALAAEDGERWRLRARARRSLGQDALAERAWDEALARMTRVTPDDYLDRARIQVSRGRINEARRGLDEGIRRLGPAIALVRARELLEIPDSVRPLPAEAASADAGTDFTAKPAETFARAAGAGPATPMVLTITRGPYLQRASSTGITIRWRTSDATDARVEYGTESGVYPDHVDDVTVGTGHEIVLGGLAPATRYWYTVGSTTEVGASGDSLTFRTHPLPGMGEPTRIWVLGDSGLPGTIQDQVRDAFVNWTGTRGPNVWLMLGDNAYSSGLDSEYQNGLFAPYRALLRQWTLWPARGNHDVVRSGADNDYYDFFTLPTAAEAGGTVSGSEAYYSFDYGDVHFVCLDSEGSDRSPGSAMLDWLTADLAANERPWTIVYFHHPPYTKGSHDSDDPNDSGGRMRDMRENVLPILEAAGVDLVLSGHSHSYERSFLLDGHYDVSSTLLPSMKKDAGDGRMDGDGPYSKPTLGSAPHEGAVYAVDGSSSQASGGPLDHPAMFASLNVPGSMVVDVDGPRLDARFLSNTGAVDDSFTVLKGFTTSVPAPADAAIRLGAALPNPFRAGVSLDYALAREADVRLDVFDPAGRRVATLDRGRRAAGRHLVRWDGSSAAGGRLPAGLYVIRLEADGHQASRRIALLR